MSRKEGCSKEYGQTTVNSEGGVRGPLVTKRMTKTSRQKRSLKCIFLSMLYIRKHKERKVNRRTKNSK